MLKKGNLVGISASLIAIIGGLLFGFIVLLVSNPANAWNGFVSLMTGGVSGGMMGVGRMLYFASSYIICGVAVGFAGKTGVFNIGNAGQMILGAFAATYIGVAFTSIPPVIRIPLAIIAAAAAGGLFAMIIGLLKAYFNISEFIVGILLNYVGLYIVNMLVAGSSIYDQLRNSTKAVPKSSMIPKMGLDTIFPHSNVDISIIIAIILAIVIYFILYRTVFGYEIRACGYNQFAGLYAGINAKRNIILSMFISGAISGIAGGFLYLSSAGNYIQVVDTLPAQAWTGISVSLLAMDNPIGIIFTGLFIAYITIGGSNMQMYGYVPEIVNVVIAAIIYFSAFVMLIRMVIVRIQKRNGENRGSNSMGSGKGAEA